MVQLLFVWSDPTRHCRRETVRKMSSVFWCATGIVSWSSSFFCLCQQAFWSNKVSSAPRPIGHFRVHLSLHFKARLSAKSLLWKSVFIHIKIETNYHNKNFALRLALKERLKGTRKWSIKPLVQTRQCGRWDWGQVCHGAVHQGREGVDGCWWAQA